MKRKSRRLERLPVLYRCIFLWSRPPRGVAVADKEDPAGLVTEGETNGGPEVERRLVRFKNGFRCLPLSASFSTSNGSSSRLTFEVGWTTAKVKQGRKGLKIAWGWDDDFIWRCFSVASEGRNGAASFVSNVKEGERPVRLGRVGLSANQEGKYPFRSCIPFSWYSFSSSPSVGGALSASVGGSTDVVASAGNHIIDAAAAAGGDQYGHEDEHVSSCAESERKLKEAEDFSIVGDLQPSSTRTKDGVEDNWVHVRPRRCSPSAEWMVSVVEGVLQRAWNASEDKQDEAQAAFGGSVCCTSEWGVDISDWSVTGVSNGLTLSSAARVGKEEGNRRDPKGRGFRQRTPPRPRLFDSDRGRGGNRVRAWCSFFGTRDGLRTEGSVLWEAESGEAEFKLRKEDGIRTTDEKSPTHKERERVEVGRKFRNLNQRVKKKFIDRFPRKLKRNRRAIRDSEEMFRSFPWNVTPGFFFFILIQFSPRAPLQSVGYAHGKDDRIPPEFDPIPSPSESIHQKINIVWIVQRWKKKRKGLDKPLDWWPTKPSLEADSPELSGIAWTATGVGVSASTAACVLHPRPADVWPCRPAVVVDPSERFPCDCRSSLILRAATRLPQSGHGFFYSAAWKYRAPLNDPIRLEVST